MSGAADLTIVVPAYRCAPYLPATLASALRCEGARILVAEDAGGDDTLEVARRWQARHPDRITVLQNPRNLGMTGNWQSTIAQVQTPFALKLDGDDVVVPSYVSAAVQSLRANERLGIIGGGMRTITPAEYVHPTEVEALADPAAPRPVEVLSGRDACRFVLRWDPFPCSSSTIYRMSAWRAVGGFDVGLSWCSDREIWFRVARGWSVAFDPAVAVLYRVHANSSTGAHGSSDRYVYEFDRMLRSAVRVWPEPELRRDFRRSLRVNTKAYFGSAWRAVKRRRFGEVLPRIARGFRSAAKTLAT